VGIRNLCQYEENYDNLTWDIWCPGNDLNQKLPNTSLKHYYYFSVVTMTMKIFIIIWVMASFGVVAEYHCFAGVAFYSGDRVGMFETVYWTT